MERKDFRKSWTCCRQNRQMAEQLKEDFSPEPSTEDGNGRASKPAGKENLPALVGLRALQGAIPGR